MTELRTFTEWLRFVNKTHDDVHLFLDTKSKEIQECLRIFNSYSGYLELATSEEKKLLRKYAYEVYGPTNKIITI